jgi:UDP-glucose 4-epimerase
VKAISYNIHFPGGKFMVHAVVTGGAGFVGRHLVRDLLETGHRVTVIDSGETGRLDLLPTQCNVVSADISTVSVPEWRKLLHDVDYVYHLAARKYNTPGVTAEGLIAANATATLNLAQVAAELEVKKFVYSSTLYAYGSLGPEIMEETTLPAPKTVYGASKLFGEYALQNKDFSKPLNWAVARFFFVYGPGQFAEGGYKSVIVSNFERISQGVSPQINGDGKQELDYVYVGDVVRALRMLARSEENILVNLGNGIGYTIREVTDLMIKVTKTNLEPIFASPDWTAGTKRVSNITKAEKVLGWKPQVSLEEGLAITWADKMGVA